jgi:hypothetical protein
MGSLHRPPGIATSPPRLPGKPQPIQGTNCHVGSPWPASSTASPSRDPIACQAGAMPMAVVAARGQRYQAGGAGRRLSRLPALIPPVVRVIDPGRGNAVEHVFQASLEFPIPAVLGESRCQAVHRRETPGVNLIRRIEQLARAAASSSPSRCPAERAGLRPPTTGLAATRPPGAAGPPGHRRAHPPVPGRRRRSGPATVRDPAVRPAPVSGGRMDACACWTIKHHVA